MMVVVRVGVGVGGGGGCRWGQGGGVPQEIDC